MLKTMPVPKLDTFMAVGLNLMSSSQIVPSNQPDEFFPAVCFLKFCLTFPFPKQIQFVIEVDALVTHVVFPVRQRNDESVFFTDFPPAVPTIDMVDTFGRTSADDACFQVIRQY